MEVLKWLWFVLMGEQGDATEGADAGDQGDAEGAADDAGTQGDSGAGADAGTDSGAKVEPKYGEFGDTPTVDDVFNKYKGITEKHKVLSGQASATEKNLNMLRKTLERYGLKVEPGEDGNLNLSTVRQEPQKRQTKFAKEHEALFDGKVLEAIKALVEDSFENLYEDRTKKSYAQLTQQKEFNNSRIKSVNTMFKFFPQLDGKWGDDYIPTNPEFDAEFHKRAEEIWKENYKNDPAGELRGALDAALEMNIPAKIVAGAEKMGFIKGKENKRILGPVMPKGAGASIGKKFTQAEYLKLDPKARETYDKEQLQVK